MPETTTWYDEAVAAAEEEIALHGMPALPYTPECRHMQPHEPRPIETRDDFVRYVVFCALGWREAGYCWSYIPRFLWEWFGKGPGQ